jgi:hypothetical protein
MRRYRKLDRSPVRLALRPLTHKPIGTRRLTLAMVAALGALGCRQIQFSGLSLRNFVVHCKKCLVRSRDAREQLAPAQQVKKIVYLAGFSSSSPRTYRASGACARLGPCLTVGASDVRRYWSKLPDEERATLTQTNSISKMFYTRCWISHV